MTGILYLAIDKSWTRFDDSELDAVEDPNEKAELDTVLELDDALDAETAAVERKPKNRYCSFYSFSLTIS